VAVCQNDYHLIGGNEMSDKPSIMEETGLRAPRRFDAAQAKQFIYRSISEQARSAYAHHS
jgi:hypothetical protein